MQREYLKTNQQQQQQQKITITDSPGHSHKKKKNNNKEEMLIRERNVISVKARADRPQFLYSRVYVGMHPGKCLEYNIDKDTSLLTRDETFKDFMERPYAIIPHGEKKYLLIVPKWTGFKAGWLESQTETYYIFRVDRYAVWSGLVPDELKQDLDLSPRYASIRLEDNNNGGVGGYSCLVGNEPEIEDAWIRYREYLLRKEKYKGASAAVEEKEEEEQRIRIKSSVSARFNLASKLIMDGIIPWAGRKVEQSWKWPTDIQLRPYQKEAIDFFVEHGSMTLVYPFGSGKTLFGVQAISCVSGKTLVVVPSVSQIAVWQKYIKQHFLPNSKPRLRLFYRGARTKDNIYTADIIISTYESALTHLTKEHFKLLIFDECHHFPANTYSRLAFLDAQYRIGLSGSPYREDGRSELIYILSGTPYGSDWDTLFEEGWVKKPEVNLHVSNGKMSLLQSMLQRLKGNTIIFCDTISLGEEVARLTGLPFIYGQHSLSKRIEAINKYHRLISSRIFDEGMDIPNIKNIIEIDFLGGSRRQQLQRVGRLMHSLIDGAEYHLIMSPYELQKYQKRLYGLYSRQFSVNVIKE
jgi:superfamily II DNA or RNA helicase